MFPISTELTRLSPQEVADCVDYVRRQRTTLDGYDVTLTGPRDPGEVAAYAAVGVTWYQVSPSFGEPLDSIRDWIAAGPPG
jgi:hypothetical protein